MCGCCQFPNCYSPGISSERKIKALTGHIVGHSGILFKEREMTAERNSSNVSETSGNFQDEYFYEQTTNSSVIASASTKLHYTEGLVGGDYTRNVTETWTGVKKSLWPPYEVFETYSGSSSVSYVAYFDPANPGTLTGTKTQESSSGVGDGTFDFSIANNLGGGFSFMTADPNTLYWSERTDIQDWDFVRATWTFPYSLPEAFVKLTEDMPSEWVSSGSAASAGLTGIVSSEDTGSKVISATLTLRRFRFIVPITHLGTYYKIIYDIAEFPTSGDPSFISQDAVVEWTGPGTGVWNDPSWLTPWVEIEPSNSVIGERRVVNVRYQCLHNSVFPFPPGATGETLIIP
jgi:hypothetical protein